MDVARWPSFIISAIQSLTKSASTSAHDSVEPCAWTNF
nr:MAG TPA: hypothetical protein [Caudoviricetes sp.]